MLDETKARAIARQASPKSTITLMTASYKNLYIYRIIRTDDPLEGDQDPFFSVNKTTGEFRDFSILTDISIDEVRRLFPTT